MFDITGLLTFSNLIFVLSILMITSAFVWLFGIYLLQIVMHIPSEVLELAMYIGFGVSLAMTPYWFTSDITYIWGLLFSTFLTAATVITGLRIKGDNPQMFNFVNMLIHGTAGIYLESSLIASVSVMFMMGFIGFQVGFGPGFVAFGYKEKDIVASAALASGVVTIVGSFLRVELMNAIQYNVPFTPLLQLAQLFVPGMLWFGPFVFFISLLIVSMKHYSCDFSPYHHLDRYSNVYFTNNFITIVASMIAILCGNLYNIPQLSGFSGTFFVLYLLEKYCELMPNRREVWAWTTLMIGIILYAVNVYYRAEFERRGLFEYFHLMPPLDDFSMLTTNKV